MIKNKSLLSKKQFFVFYLSTYFNILIIQRIKHEYLKSQFRLKIVRTNKQERLQGLNQTIQ